MRAISPRLIQLVIATLLIGNGAQAATYTVVNLNDAGPGSLRDAILSANTNGGGEINFAAEVTGTILLATNLPLFTANINLRGPGTNLLTVSGSHQARAFSMASGTTNVVSGLTIADTFREGPIIPPGGRTFGFASGISNASSLRLCDCVLSNCQVYVCYGAGIYNSGSLTMERCLLKSCGDHGGTPNFGTQGGGIYNDGALDITHGSFLNCQAGTAGGGINNNGTLSISASWFSGCTGVDGGGISNQGKATLNDCVITSCGVGYYGGGLRNSAIMNITNCSITKCGGQSGSAMLNSGTAFANGCTFSQANGGGCLENLGDLRLYNCTISSNVFPTAYPAPGGSAIIDGVLLGFARVYPSSLFMEHCTVVSNSGPVQVYTLNAIDAEHSILSDCSGILTSSNGHNLLIATNGTVFTNNTSGNIYGVNPMLGALQNNGGPTWTHALLMGSPAINAAGPGDATPTDQRGVSRPQGPASDIGAYELSYAPPNVASLSRDGSNHPWVRWDGFADGGCTVQGSADFVHWVDLGAPTRSGEGVLDFVDTDPGGSPVRFYRLKMQVPP